MRREAAPADIPFGLVRLYLGELLAPLRGLVQCPGLNSAGFRPQLRAAVASRLKIAAQRGLGSWTESVRPASRQSQGETAYSHPPRLSRLPFLRQVHRDKLRAQVPIRARCRGSDNGPRISKRSWAALARTHLDDHCHLHATGPIGIRAPCPIRRCSLLGKRTAVAHLRYVVSDVSPLGNRIISVVRLSMIQPLR